MRYREFVECIIAGLEDVYGDGATISIGTVVGNNDSLRAILRIVFKDENEEICPVIYLDSLYDDYLKNMQSLEYVIDMLVQIRNNYEPDGRVKDGAKKLMDWESIKASVFPVLVSKTGNDQFLSNYVHTIFLDLAVIYEVRLNENEEGIDSSKVTYNMLKHYGVSEGELHQKALENMKQDGYWIADMIHLLLGGFADDSDQEIDMSAGQMYTFTNKIGHHGAAGLLHEDFLKRKLGNNTAYIIPSSIHEILLAPVTEGMSADTFNEAICQINETEVRASERLSNHCYIWDGNDQKVKMAA